MTPYDACYYPRSRQHESVLLLLLLLSSLMNFLRPRIVVLLHRQTTHLKMPPAASSTPPRPFHGKQRPIHRHHVKIPRCSECPPEAGTGTNTDSMDWLSAMWMKGMFPVRVVQHFLIAAAVRHLGLGVVVISGGRFRLVAPTRHSSRRSSLALLEHPPRNLLRRRCLGPVGVYDFFSIVQITDTASANRVS